MNKLDENDQDVVTEPKENLIVAWSDVKGDLANSIANNVYNQLSAYNAPIHVALERIEISLEKINKRLDDVDKILEDHKRKIERLMYSHLSFGVIIFMSVLISTVITLILLLFKG